MKMLALGGALGLVVGLAAHAQAAGSRRDACSNSRRSANSDYSVASGLGPPEWARQRGLAAGGAVPAALVGLSTSLPSDWVGLVRLVDLLAWALPPLHPHPM